MPQAPTRVAPTGTGDRSRPRAALPALCATQITSWGIVYYAFPVLNARITADTGWSTTATTGAFSAALVVSALAGIPVGRILDRRGRGRAPSSPTRLPAVPVRLQHMTGCHGGQRATENRPGTGIEAG